MGGLPLRPFSLSRAALDAGDTASQVVITGQSLALGGVGHPAISTTEAENVFEPDGIDYAYSVESGLETPRGALLRTMQATRGGVWAATLAAKSGTEYVGIKKGTATYTAAMDGVAEATVAAGSAGASNVVRAVHVIHGEADMREATTRAQYATNLAEWSSDYSADVAVAAGQTEPVPMIACQVTSWPEYVAFPTVGLAQLDAHRAGDIVLVGPKYQLDDVGDGVHLRSYAYYHLGELHARALDAMLAGGWDPVAPVSITIAGPVITARFSVPVAPLTFDTDTVPAQAAHGFSYTDDGTPPAIDAVEAAGDTVTITLASAPTGANPRLRYGCVSGAGNLRDSETAVSTHDGAPLANWCVHFDDPIPFEAGQ